MHVFLETLENVVLLLHIVYKMHIFEYFYDIFLVKNKQIFHISIKNCFVIIRAS